MTTNDPLAIIYQIRVLLDQLQKTIPKYSKPKKTLEKKQDLKSFKGPKGGILLLISDGFFKKPQTLPQVVQKLKQEGYHYLTQVISTALVRLVRNRVLVRVEADNSLGKEKWAYVERR